MIRNHQYNNFYYCTKLDLGMYNNYEKRISWTVIMHQKWGSHKNCCHLCIQ